MFVYWFFIYYNTTFCIVIPDNTTSKHMRYANSLESLDSVSSSIQQARAYSRHTVSKNSQIIVTYDEGIQQFLPKKQKSTLFFWKIIVPKSQHFVLWYYFFRALGFSQHKNILTHLLKCLLLEADPPILFSKTLCIQGKIQIWWEKKCHSLCQILPSLTIYKLVACTVTYLIFWVHRISPKM